MSTQHKSPLTGGMMVIIMPGRKGDWSTDQEGKRIYIQQNTQQLVKLSQDAIEVMACKPLPDEIEYRRQADFTMKTVTKLKHPIEKRMQHWLHDHFLSVIGSHQLHESRCSWSFKHDQF